jgi:hypothetical protein
MSTTTQTRTLASLRAELESQTILALRATLEAQAAHIAKLEAAGERAETNESPLCIADEAWNQTSLKLLRERPSRPRH